MRLALCCTLAVLICGCPARALAQDRDPWWGPDKALHASASAVVAAGGYAVGTSVFDARYEALLLGGSVALAAGVAKEAADAAGWGSPSWRDLAWDLIGTAAGLSIAWGLDIGIRGGGGAHPPFGAPTRRGSAMLTVGFGL